MSDRHSSSPLPSCLRPPPSAAAADHLPPPGASAVCGNSNLTTSLYHTDLGIFSLTWSRCFLGRSLHLQLYPSAGAANVSPLSGSASGSGPAFSLHLKPLVFWKKWGWKKLNGGGGGREIRVFWDLRRARFGSGPEPEGGFYVAAVVDGEMKLVVGDAEKEAYGKSKARRGEKSRQMLVLRREHVLGKKVYRTKARFGGESREISIDWRRVGGDQEGRLSFWVDGRRVLQIKRLKWKFRGNERIEVEGVAVQVSWDVYNWLFEDATEGHAVFMFRIEKSGGLDEEEEDSHSHSHSHSDLGLGGMMTMMNGAERKKMRKTTRSSSSSSLSLSSASSSGCSSSVMEWASREEMELNRPSAFSLLIYAWKS